MRCLWPLLHQCYGLPRKIRRLWNSADGNIGYGSLFLHFKHHHRVCSTSRGEPGCGGWILLALSRCAGMEKWAQAYRTSLRDIWRICFQLEDMVLVSGKGVGLWERSWSLGKELVSGKGVGLWERSWSLGKELVSGKGV